MIANVTLTIILLHSKHQLMMENDINIRTQTVDEGVLRLVKKLGIQKSGSVGKPFATVERTYEISDRLLTGVDGITVSR